MRPQRKRRRAERREPPCESACGGGSSIPLRLLAAACLLLALLVAGSHAHLHGQLQQHAAELAAAQKLHLQELFSDRYVWAQYAEDAGADRELSQEEQDTLALLELLDTPGFWASTWGAAKSKVAGAVAATVGTYDAARVKLLDAQIAAAQKRRDTKTVSRLTQERTKYVQSYQQNQKARQVAAQQLADNQASAKAAAKQYGAELAQGAKDLAVAGSTVVKIGYNAYQINSRSDRLWELERQGKGQSPEAVQLRNEILAASRNMSNNEKIQRERMASAKANVPTLLNSGKSLALGTKGIGDVIVGGVKTGASTLSVAAANQQLASLKKAGVKANDPRMVAAQRAVAAANASANAAKAQVQSGVRDVGEHGETVVRTAAMANPVLAVGVAAYDVGTAARDSAVHAADGNYKAAALAAGRGVLHAAAGRVSGVKIQNSVGTARAAAALKQQALTTAAKQASAKSATAAAKARNLQNAAAKTATKETAAQAKLLSARQQLAAAQAKAKSNPSNAARANVSKAQQKVAAAQKEHARAQATAATQRQLASKAQTHAGTQAQAAVAARARLKNEISPEDINLFNANKYAPPNKAPLKQRVVQEGTALAKKKGFTSAAGMLHGVEKKTVEQHAAQQQAATVAAQQRQQQLLQAQARQAALKVAANKKSF